MIPVTDVMRSPLPFMLMVLTFVIVDEVAYAIALKRERGSDAPIGNVDT